MLLLLASYFLATLAAALPAHAQNAGYSVEWKTQVGCLEWGPGCWVPGFRGTDSSPSFYDWDGTEDAVAIGSYDSNVYGVSASDGRVLFKANGSGGEGSPSVGPDSIFSWGVLTGTTLDCLDKKTGERRWAWKPPCKGEIATSGPFDSEYDIIYAGTTETHNFYAVNASNGATIWRTKTNGEMWGTLGALVVKDKDMVCVGAGGNAIPSLNCSAQLVCMKRSSGEIVWQARAGKQIQSRASYSSKLSTIYVGDYDGCLYAFDAENGNLKFKVCNGQIIEGSSLVVRDDIVVFSSYDGSVHAISAHNGSTLFTTALGKGAIASTPRLHPTDGTIVVGGQDGLYVLDTFSGKILWSFATHKLVGSSPAISADGQRVAFGCEDGFLYMLKRTL